MQNCLFNLNLNNITFSTLWVQITIDHHLYSKLCFDLFNSLERKYV